MRSLAPISILSSSASIYDSFNPHPHRSLVPFSSLCLDSKVLRFQGLHKAEVPDEEPIGRWEGDVEPLDIRAAKQGLGDEKGRKAGLVEGPVAAVSTSQKSESPWRPQVPPMDGQLQAPDPAPLPQVQGQPGGSEGSTRPPAPGSK